MHHSGGSVGKKCRGLVTRTVVLFRTNQDWRIVQKTIQKRGCAAKTLKQDL